jgi:CBS domain-containing protein
VDTSAIAYRVADFLKQHPPFESITDAELRELATRGRVRFFEANEYILWQGEPHKSYVFVIQQGTVSLWDEHAGASALRDVRGAGDLLGIESFTGARSCLYSATSSSDVVIYALRTDDFERIVLARPDARRFIEAYDSVSSPTTVDATMREPHQIELRELLSNAHVETCTPLASVQDVAQLIAAGREAVGVLDDDNALRGIVTSETIVEWVARGHQGHETVGRVLGNPPPRVNESTSVADAALTLAEHHVEALAVSADPSSGSLQQMVTRRLIGRVFGDDPVSIVRDMRVATTPAALQAILARSRALTLRHLSDSTSVEWLERFASLTDATVVRRLIALDGHDDDAACWCFCGTAGRGESFTAHAPELLVIANDDASVPALREQHARIREALVACGLTLRNETPFDPAFHVASLAEWQARYRDWFREPVRTEMYRARPLLDLRPVHGNSPLWSAVEACAIEGADPTFLLVLANDCLTSLPPLTFFQDAVLDTSGEQATVFKLEESALRPLVDVGRVFGLATKRVVGTSTVERLTHAAEQHPGHERIFEEAAETFRILLRQQARAGIMHGTTGSELPATALSRHDRHVLKSGFRSILALIEFTRGAFWLESA